MPTELADLPVVFRPSQWRFRGLLITSIIVAVPIVGAVIALTPLNAFALAGLLLLSPLVVAVWAAALTARSVRVIAGQRVEFRGIWFERRVVPLTTDAEILWYANVEGSTRLMLGRKVRTPIGVRDQRWAVLRCDGVTVLRLSTWYWRKADLERLSSTLPARLAIMNERVSPMQVDKLVPDYYTWLEHHPRTYLTLVVAVEVAAVATGTVAFFAVGFLVRSI